MTNNYYEIKNQYESYKHNIEVVDSLKANEIKKYTDYYNTTQEEIQYYKIFFSMVQHQYEIQMDTIVSESATNYSLRAEKVDSALLLLDKYRTKLIFNKKDGYWMVQ